MIAASERHRWAICVAAIVSTFGSVAQAGGFHLPDLGASALARGGAFVARSDDPTGIYHNPGALGRLRGTHFFISGTLLDERLRFDRRQYKGGNADQYPAPLNGPMPSIRNTAGPVVVPVVAFSTDLGFLQRWNLNVIGGIYAPNGPPTRRFPLRCKSGVSPCEPDPNGLPSPARYEVYEVDLVAVYPSVGLAWRPFSWLSVGGVLQLAYADALYRTNVAALAHTDKENPDYDVPAAFDTKSGVTPTAIFGVHLRPFRFLELGFSARIGFDFDTRGTACIGEKQTDGSCAIPERTRQALPLPLDAVPNPATATLVVPKPWIVRSGIRYINYDHRSRPRFDVELNVVWEGWSVLKELAAELDTPVDIVYETGQSLNRVTRIGLKHNYQDTVSVRLGGSYSFRDLFANSTLTVSLGAYYESSAVPDAYTRLDFVPLERIGVGGGVSWRYGRTTLFLSYVHTASPVRNVAPETGQKTCDEKSAAGCGSQVRLVAPTLLGAESKRFGRAIGNGRYEVAINQLSLGLKISFGSR